MKKAPSTILATAGLTVGMLGFALPASAATVVPNPGHAGIGQPPFLSGSTGGSTGDSTGGSWGGSTGGSNSGSTRGWTGGRTGGSNGHGRTPPKHYPKPGQHPKPKPTATCHPQAPKPKYPVRPIGYNKGSNENKGYTTALYSWEHSKSGHTIKCDPKPAPPKHHHHAPKKHWWQGWFN